MPLKAAKCPICGAGIQVPSEREKIFCTECGKQIIPSAAIAFYNAVFGKADTAPAETAAKPPQKPLGAYIQKLKDAGIPMRLNSPATLDNIAQFDQEKKVNTTDVIPQPKPLPPAVREFLQYANGGQFFIPETELFGIGPKENRALAFWQLELANTKRYDLWNPSIYIIGRTGSGEALHVDLDSHKLICYDREKEKVTYSWDSIVDFLEEELQEYLKRKDFVHPSIQRLVDIQYRYGTYSPADEQSISKWEQKYGILLPAHYRNLLRFADGFWLRGIYSPKADFFGLDELGKKKYVNKQIKYEIPGNMYIVGEAESPFVWSEGGQIWYSGYGDGRVSLCIDINTQELVQWINKKKCETRRWASVFDYIDDEYKRIIHHEAKMGGPLPEIPYKVREAFYNSTALYLNMEEGEFAGQTIRVRPNKNSADGYEWPPRFYEQIKPISRADMTANRNIEVLREIIDRDHAFAAALTKYYGVTEIDLDGFFKKS